LDGVGSILFSLTWNRKATPLGRPYCQLAASGRPTSVNDFGSWPTPMAGTPAQRGYNEAGNTDSSRKTLALVSWPTPTANENMGDLDKKNERRARMKEKWKGITGNGFGHSLAEAAQMASWPTPRAEDSESSGMRHSRGVADTMTAVASLASWATPSARDWKDSGDLETSRFRQDGKERNDTIPRQAFGAQSIGSHAQTEKPGQLNPEHSRWVMGYPTVHLSCAPTETRSSLRRQRSSSVPASSRTLREQTR
jgi:hypothetical protein